MAECFSCEPRWPCASASSRIFSTLCCETNSLASTTPARHQQRHQTLSSPAPSLTCPASSLPCARSLRIVCSCASCLRLSASPSSMTCVREGAQN